MTWEKRVYPQGFTQLEVEKEKKSDDRKKLEEENAEKEKKVKREQLEEDERANQRQADAGQS